MKSEDVDHPGFGGGRHRGRRPVRLPVGPGPGRHPGLAASCVQAWADYSRHADLGTGNVVYPIGGILLWALVFAAAVSHLLDRSAPRAAGLPIYLAALFSIGAIVATIVAAPIMRGVGSLGNDPVALQSAFDRFTLWGVYVRGVFFAASFLCTVWALTVTSRNTARREAIDRCSGGAASS